jgi:hypothetical protein
VNHSQESMLYRLVLLQVHLAVVRAIMWGNSKEYMGIAFVF